MTSPDGSIKVLFDLKDKGGKSGCPVYRVSYHGKELVSESRLGVELAGGDSLRDGFRLKAQRSSEHDRAWNPVYGERGTVRDNYRQMDLDLASDALPDYSLRVTLRCYDSGVAFCYTIQRRGEDATIAIEQEHTEFRFPADHVVWTTSRAQGEYRKTTLSRLGKEAERPVTIEVDENTCVALGEAKLVDYARMKFQALGNGFGARSKLAGPVRGATALTTPWRVIMIAGSPGGLLENNDLFLNLNDPCAIEDPSWIKPGKVIREVTMTTTGAKACVDFAARRNLQYVEFDAGWYGPENDAAADATTVTLDPRRSRGPLDLPEIIRYADERGIGVLLYVNRRALEKQLDELLPLYRKWGIKGMKYGFVNVGSQEWTRWLHEAVRKAAAYQMMVDVHDEYRPTGYSRTWPNLMTQEGIRGDETRPSNRTTLTILFTRMLAGAGDNTICYHAAEVSARCTHASQLAKAVCLYSPWQFLYWYDCPSRAPGGRGGKTGDTPELEFYDQVPTVWDDTKVLKAGIGTHAVIARRAGKDWFVGAMNSEEPRDLTVSLDFLEAGRPYEATIYRHDPNVKTTTHVRIERRKVTAETNLKMVLGSNDGQAMRIVPTPNPAPRAAGG